MIFEILTILCWKEWKKKRLCHTRWFKEQRKCLWKW